VGDAVHDGAPDDDLRLLPGDGDLRHLREAGEGAKAYGDECLATIFRLNARDEIAHCRFYEDVVKVLLEEDREGTLLDIAHVAKHFQMPGVGIVPDYDERIKVMREEGKVDRSVFLQKVFFPVLKYLDVTRQELADATFKQRAASNEERRTRAAE
jgi:acyl-[acyl-carrier-protein] desaturase